MAAVIVGHAFIAFVLAAAGAVWVGVDRHRAMRFGVIAGAFAVVPDVDMAYAVVGVLHADSTGVWAATAAFWDASKAVHRAVTHSLVIAIPAAVGFALASDRHWRLAALAPLAGIVALGWAVEGMLAAVMLGMFVLAGVAVASAAGHVGIGRYPVLLAALIGLGSHPFGDLFTGTPPPMLYPIGPAVFGERVVLLGEPTFNLLGVFGLELAAIWAGVLVAAWLSGWSLPTDIDRRAILGALYGAVVFVLPPPTLEMSYHFVFSVVGVGTVGMMTVTSRPVRPRIRRAALTGLAAMTLAWAAYGLVYAVA